jgi:beta-galactosidase GanA
VILQSIELSDNKSEWSLPKQVELVIRRNEVDGSTCTFLLNYSNESQQIELHRSAKDLLTGNELFGIAALDPYGVLVLV